MSYQGVPAARRAASFRHVAPMPAPLSEDDPHAVSEATQFLILLVDDPADTALHAKIQQWRKASPTHDAAWQSLVTIWHLAGDIGPVALPLPATPPLPAQSLAGAWRPLWQAGAVAMVCLLGLGFVLGSDIRLALLADYRTGTAENRVVQLPDGSTATLGARSAIALDYTPGQRQVRVLAGEVFFTIRHDSTRPFVTQAGKMTARDIGTRFNVSKNDRHIDVAVNEGCVGLAYAALAEQRLNAGDAVSIDIRTGTLQTSHVDPAEVGSWRQERLTVSDATVATVVETLRRYYPGFILTYGSRLEHAHIAGTYDLTDIPGALRAVAAPAHGAVHGLGPHILLMGARTP